MQVRACFLRRSDGVEHAYASTRGMAVLLKLLDQPQLLLLRASLPLRPCSMADKATIS